MQQGGDITVPGRKLLDIFRRLPEKTSVTLSTEGERVSIRGGRSRFTLSTLPAAEFPVVEEINAQQTLTVGAGRVPAAHRQDAFLDGAAGRALLPERTAARDRGQVTARGGHRRASTGAVRDGADGARRRAPRSRSSCRARACWSCSGSWERDGNHRAGDRNESRSRPDRRHSLHFEADRWSFPGVRARDSRQPCPQGRGRPRGPRARRCSARPFCRTRSIAASASRPGRICLTLRRITPSRRRRRTRSRSATRARKSRSAST